MNTNNNLAANLNSYRKFRKLSVNQLAKELDIPVSTLRSILNNGNTTLDTVIRISRSTGLGLDALVYSPSFSQELFILQHMENMISWNTTLTTEKKEKIADFMIKMWESLK